MNTNRTLLQTLKVYDSKDAYLYADRTRDLDKVNVMRDCRSGVIFIDDYIDHIDTYRQGDYRVSQQQGGLGVNAAKIDRQAQLDLARRLELFSSWCEGLRVCDYGCGAGDFLKVVSEQAQFVHGVELQADYVDKLNNLGIPCSTSLDDKQLLFDLVFMFHSLEHMNEPLEILQSIRSRMQLGGKIVVEVPSADDILLGEDPLPAFKEFSLWSQHQILHTKASLSALLTFAGFKGVRVEGCQRYDLDNHLGWQINGKPGGYGLCKNAQYQRMNRAYIEGLMRDGKTDTLIATACVA